MGKAIDRSEVVTFLKDLLQNYGESLLISSIQLKPSSQTGDKNLEKQRYDLVIDMDLDEFNLVIFNPILLRHHLEMKKEKGLWIITKQRD
jgi:hypothetical protein